MVCKERYERYKALRAEGLSASEAARGSKSGAVATAKRVEDADRSPAPGSKRPGGYVTHDVDEHGLLSPQVNRADGFGNNKSDNYVQSHHPVQDKWAENNIDGYKRNDAPAILLESASGQEHAKISAAQRARRRDMKKQGKDPWSTSVEEEFNIGYQEMIDAGVPEDKAKKAIKDSYKYFDDLGAFDK